MRRNLNLVARNFYKMRPCFLQQAICFKKHKNKPSAKALASMRRGLCVIGKEVLQSFYMLVAGIAEGANPPLLVL